MNSPTAVHLPATPPVLHYLPARNAKGKVPLVLLHGWGHSRLCWQPLTSHLKERDVYLLDLPGFGESRGWVPSGLDEALVTLADLLPPSCVLVGWSLGGHLALRLARRNPGKILGVITLATNVRFVAAEGWPQAMSREIYRGFCDDFSTAPGQTLKRFAALQAQGDSDSRVLLKVLREQCSAPEPAQVDQWQQSLEWLGQFDHRPDFSVLKMPLLHLFAEGDALVPAAAAEVTRAISPGTVQVLGRVGHAFPISQPKKTAAAIGTFLMDQVDHQAQRHTLDKRHIARSFSRAAVTYDSAAHVQVRVGRRLLRMAPAVAGLSVLDLGCGTGFCSRILRQRGAVPVGLDIAPGMLRQARHKLGTESELVCADAEHLPFRPGSFAGIVSNLTIQWSQCLPQLLRELREGLEPGGWLLFSTLGPGTLEELRQAWRVVDRGRHVNDFVAGPRLRQFLHDAGLAVEIFETETVVPRYRELRDLMYDLKAIGAHNVSSEQRRGLASPAVLRRLLNAYEPFRGVDGKLPATHEVFYVLARRKSR